VPRELLPNTQNDLHICKLLSDVIIYNCVWYKKIFYKDFFSGVSLTQERRLQNIRNSACQRDPYFASMYCKIKAKTKCEKNKKIEFFSKNIILLGFTSTFSSIRIWMSNCIEMTLRGIMQYNFLYCNLLFALVRKSHFLFIAIFLFVHFCIVSPEYDLFHGLRNVAKFVGNFYLQ
jgi:hypothetical protein